MNIKLLSILREHSVSLKQSCCIEFPLTKLSLVRKVWYVQIILLLAFFSSKRECLLNEYISATLLWVICLFVVVYLLFCVCHCSLVCCGVSGICAIFEASS